MVSPALHSLDPTPATLLPPRPARATRRVAWGAVLGCAATAAAVQLGGGWWAAAAGVAMVACLSRSSSRAEHAAEQSPLNGAPLVHQVLAVWMRQLDAARDHAEQSTGEVLGAFSTIDERLEEAVRLAEVSSADLTGAHVDALIDDNQAVLDQLLEPLRLALQARDGALAEVDRIGPVLDGLRTSAARMRQAARRINMVALNASVESARAGDRSGSFAVLAEEVRGLAQQSTADAGQLLSQANRLEEQLRALRVQAATRDSSDEELRAQADTAARQAIGGLLDSVGRVARSSRGLKQAGSDVRSQIERLLMGFQSQDRLNQMLSTVTEDMHRLREWLQHEGDLSQAQATEWLARLESRYTMEEQRVQHHGNTEIERSAQVEFF